MTGFNHMLTGVSIAVLVRNPILAPIIALISHMALDMLPHFGRAKWMPDWSKQFKIMISLDGVLCAGAVLLGYALFPQHWILITVCSFAALLPDFFWLIESKFKQHWFFRMHRKIQWGERPWGFWIEIPFAAMIVVFLVSWQP